MELEIKGALAGRDEVKAMINAAPEVFIRYLRRSLNNAAVYFIGRKKGARPKRGQFTGKGSRAKSREWKQKFVDPAKHGLIRAQLHNKRTGIGKAYSDKFLNTAFNYRIENSDRIEMKLRAGTLYTEKKKVHEIIEFLEQGGTIHSSKYMPVPIYENISSKPAGFKGYQGIFKFLLKNKRLSQMFKNGRVYYVDKTTGKLLFVGTKSISVAKQFEFYGKWNEAQSKIISDLHVSIDNACRDVQELN